MGAERATAVFSDPPYNVAIDGHVSGLGKVRHLMAAGEMTPEAFTAFLTAALDRMKESSDPGLQQEETATAPQASYGLLRE